MLRLMTMTVARVVLAIAIAAACAGCGGGTASEPACEAPTESSETPFECNDTGEG
jgi:ABC-type glycerol-3-phosphate transport system substrate-binding protein